MKIEFEPTRNQLLVRLAGELDEHTATQFREAVEARLDEDGDRDLLLDLAAVTFIDSSGLGAILGRYKRISQAERKMAFAAASPQVRRILELSGLLKIIPLAATGDGKTAS
ncbi:MAG: anti-sigma factor antagonist [Chloroflexota bacterium]